MAKIYRSTDRISLKIGDVTVKVAPLTFHQKSEIQLAMHDSAKSGDTMGILKATFLCVKYAVKDIKGVQSADGSEYSLEMEGDVLTDESVNDLFSLQESDSLSMVCINLLQGRHEDFVNVETREKLKGVKLLNEGPAGKKSKKIVGS